MNIVRETILPCQRQDLTLQQIGNEFVIYDQVNGRVHVLNDTALEVWRHCDSETPIASFVDEICQRYGGVPREVLLSDIEELLAQLRAEGLLN